MPVVVYDIVPCKENPSLQQLADSFCSYVGSNSPVAVSFQVVRLTKTAVIRNRVSGFVDTLRHSAEGVVELRIRIENGNKYRGVEVSAYYQFRLRAGMMTWVEP